MADHRDPNRSTTRARRSRAGSGRWIGTTVIVLVIIVLLAWWVGAFEGAELEQELETTAPEAPATDTPATE